MTASSRPCAPDIVSRSISVHDAIASVRATAVARWALRAEQLGREPPERARDQAQRLASASATRPERHVRERDRRSALASVGIASPGARAAVRRGACHPVTRPAARPRRSRAPRESSEDGHRHHPVRLLVELGVVALRDEFVEQVVGIGAPGTARAVGPGSEQLVGDDLRAVGADDLAHRRDEPTVSRLGDEHDEVDRGRGEQVRRLQRKSLRVLASRTARAC